MKIYISVDMEGISCINNQAYTFSDGALYSEGRELITGDVNAAVQGAIDAGADEVIVADMHSASNNIIASKMHPQALLLSGTPTLPRFAFLDEKVDGMILLGYHAKSGTLRGTLEHTMSSMSWAKFCVNKEEYGEVAIDALIAGESGVPIVMVSGDDHLVKESKALLGDQIEGACVKQGLGRQHTLCLPKERAQKEIYDKAKNCVERLKKGEQFPLFLPPAPYTIDLTYKHSADADAALSNGYTRVDGFTVQKTVSRMADLYGGLWKEQNIDQVIF